MSNQFRNLIESDDISKVVNYLERSSKNDLEEIIQAYTNIMAPISSDWSNLLDDEHYSDHIDQFNPLNTKRDLHTFLNFTLRIEQFSPETIENFKDFSSSVFLLKNLKRLEISELKISSITSLLSNLTKRLLHLDISTNEISELPNTISRFPFLTSLRLDNNLIEKLPDSFKVLNQLTELNISSNRLKTFPKEISNFSKLRSLDISHNRITGNLPEELAALKLLRTFYLNDNSISDIETLAHLQELKTLSITGNPVTSLNGRLTNLNSISISFNQIDILKKVNAEIKILTIHGQDETINLNCIAKFTKLEQLTLEFLIIDTLSALDIFESLRSLTIKNCNLSVIPKALYKLKRLKWLNIGHNSINQIDSNINLLSNLNYLTINNNNLSSLTELFKMQNLRSVDAQDNNFSPDEIKNITSYSGDTYFSI